DDTQVNWNDLYMANRLAKDDGQSARYILEERHNDQKQVVLSSILNRRQSDHLKTAGGIEARYTKGLHYKTVADLLGADRFSDIDQYTENYSPLNPNIQYNDLNSTSTYKKKDDVFGYNYTIDVLNSNAWFQNNHSYNTWDYYYAAKVDYTRFQREGMMRNGRSPNNSYGRGQVHSFLTHTVKAGATWKPSGNHLVSANLLAATNPPLPNNA
ncbi:MAG: TonB-dependent receptor, partial [Bacteroidales bacterium]|nr:TonB-dependent receptor [Bacteroidales bacterium]